METAPPRRASFLDEEEYGLASLADTEAGFSGSHHLHHHHHQSAVLNRSVLCFSKRSSLRSIVSMSGPGGSPRSVRFADGRVEDFREPHFLDACFLCRKPLGDNRDIFMYRGDTPFCSEECRQEQIEMDEAKEKNKNLSSMKAMRNKDQKKSSSSRSSSGQTYSFRTGTVAAG